MEQESNKLTGARYSRYDRYMSETGADTLEKPSKTREEELHEKWAPKLEKAGSNINLREAMLGCIKRGEEPRDELDQDVLRKMSEEDVNRKFSNMVPKPEIKRPEDLRKMETILNGYAERMKGAMGEIGDDSVPPGEVLNNMDSWKDYGWRDVNPERGISDKDAVITDIMQVFNGDQGLSLDEKQAEIIMEILLVQGKKPEDLTHGKLQAVLSEAVHGVKTPNDFSHMTEYEIKEAKGDPYIVALRVLGIDMTSIKHFILNDKDYYGHENDQEIDYSPPKNIEELAWQMMHTPGKQYTGWGIKGDFPLLEMVIEPQRDADGNPKTINGVVQIDEKLSRYRVNTANMVRWAKYNIFTAYALDRETPHNFFQEIALKKRYPLSLQEMLLNPDQYFRSEDGISYKEGLLLEWYKEAAIMTTVRQWDCLYRGVAGDPEELPKVFKEIFNTQNLLTRNALGANIFNLMSTMPLDYKGIKEGKWQSDSKMGAAWMDIYRAYDSMTDFVGLQRVLGQGSKFFTLKGWEEAIGEIAKETITATGVDKVKVFANKEYEKYFQKAFDDNGEISTRDNRVNFIKFINIFGPKMIGGKVEWTIRAALRGAVAEKYGAEVYVYQAKKGPKGEKIVALDKNGKPITKHAFVPDQGRKSEKIGDRVEDSDSLNLAEMIAWSLVKPFGAGAKNDPDGVGHDWMARVYNTEIMRKKYPHKGDKFGNEYTLSAIKKTGVDPLNGVVTEATTNILDDEGHVIIDPKTGEPKFRYKTIMEVMTELSVFKTASANQLRTLQGQLEGMKVDSPEAKKKRKEIEDFNKLADQEYQNKAGDMSFGQRTLSNYWEDHLKFGIDLYKQVVSAEEIDFGKFTTFDVFGGVRFEAHKFQAEVQDKWIHKIRYMMDTYPSLNFNMKVRVMDQAATYANTWLNDKKSEPVYKEVFLGEAMFGHEMLNRPKFWKREKNRDGTENPKGKPICMKDKNGRKMKGIYEIDYQKVQENKQDVWKQWFLTKLAGDLHSHRALHSSEPRFNFTYYENVIDSIGRIAGEIKQDEFNMRQTVVTKHFFSKADLQWLRQMSETEKFDLYWRAILKDLFYDDKPEEGIGLLLALSLATQAIITQKV